MSAIQQIKYLMSNYGPYAFPGGGMLSKGQTRFVFSMLLLCVCTSGAEPADDESLAIQSDKTTEYLYQNLKAQGCTNYNVIFDVSEGCLYLPKTPGPDLTNLNFLAGLSLKLLDLSYTKPSDFSFLKKMRVEELSLRGCPVTDLSALSGMKSLRSLTLCYTLVNDLTPIAKLSISGLDIQHTRVKNIDVIRQMPLEWLRLSPQQITNNASVFRDCKTLEHINGMPAEEFVACFEGTAVKGFVASEDVDIQGEWCFPEEPGPVLSFIQPVFVVTKGGDALRFVYRHPHYSGVFPDEVLERKGKYTQGVLVLDAPIDLLNEELPCRRFFAKRINGEEYLLPEVCVMEFLKLSWKSEDVLILNQYIIRRQKEGKQQPGKRSAAHD